MSVLMKVVLVLFGLAYLISPVDLIPDLLLPWLGWIDDSVIIWSIYYLIRYGELPWFLLKKKAGNRFPDPPPGTGRNTAAGAQRPRSENPGADNASGPGPQHSRTTRTDPSGQSRKTKSPIEILGVKKNATQREIHAAYKEKIKQYHPDKLSHLGKEFTDLANEKFLEIQAAYDALKKRD